MKGCKKNLQRLLSKSYCKGKGTVHFKTKPMCYFVPGQSIVFYNFTKGGSRTDLLRLNGRWPTKKEKGKKVQLERIYFSDKC